MGKSDPFIFHEYERALNGLSASSIAFLGFSQDNDFTRKLQATTRHFYDLSLGNWEINDEWNLQQKYDLIICTRCAYFAKDPQKFVSRCLDHLNPESHALIDWGLGDHWRFQNFKVGWVREDEHEYAYGENNKLYSCFWKDDLLKDREVNMFWENVKKIHQNKYGNSLLSEVIKQEVPRLVCYETEKVLTKFLWPKEPQLYIITLIKNSLRS